MQAHVFEGYFEDGRFYTNERQAVEIPDRHKVYITLFDERADKKAISARVEKQPFADLFGKWSGKIWMSDDFDAPLEEMTEYMG